MISPFSAMVQALLLRDLRTLADELHAYGDGRLVWRLPPELPNSGGTLILHLTGNLQHYVGAVLGSSGYVRDRQKEFGARELQVDELMSEIRAAEEAVRQTLRHLREEQLAARYPEPIRNHTLQTSEMLLHLATHLAYHLGQVSYHRRLVTGNGTGVGALPSGVLSTARPVEASDTPG